MILTPGKFQVRPGGATRMLRRSGVVVACGQTLARRRHHHDASRAGTSVTWRADASPAPGPAPQVRLRQHGPQHRPDLELRERGADAAPHAAAERDPRVGRRAVSSRKRSGRNACGSGYRSGRSCTSAIAGTTIVPARNAPARRVARRAWRRARRRSPPGARAASPSRPRRRTSSSPSRPRRAGDRIAPGLRSRRSNAHASAVALVSCPAVSSVISSSRSSRSVIGLPSSWRACSSSESTSSRSPASGSARRRRISS